MFSRKIALTCLCSFFAVSCAVVSFSASASDMKIDMPLPYDDVRSVDLRTLDFSGYPDLPVTLSYNEETLWPTADKLPAGFDPAALMEEGKNPGLGVRTLHARGITGAGVNVAIIDQPILQDHPEYVGKVAAYHNNITGEPSSMHGPAVCSLLVGTNCGTAPGARVYYATAASWTGDAAWYAQALDWLVEQNAALPQAEKIRVVSVSAAPSGPGSPFTQNNEMWDAACQRAEAAGMLVLDCTSHRGIIAPSWRYGEDRENVADYQAGFPGLSGGYVPDYKMCAPTSQRTTAQHYDYQGRNSHIYWGRGGLSWGIPYAAGVLAMGWQIHPELTKDQMTDILHSTAYCDDVERHYISPASFIAKLQTTLQRGGNYFLAPGKRFSLKAAAFGSSYQWWKDGQPFSDEEGRVTGANTRSLNIAYLVESDQGSYTCTYDDGAGVIETEAYVLTFTETLPAASTWGLLALAVLMIVAACGILKPCKSPYPVRISP